MNRIKKRSPASLAATTGLKQMDDNSGEKLSSINNHNTFDPLRQIATDCRLNELMSQASRLMSADPQRCGDHFLIWLSCFCAKNGLDWEAQK